MARLRGLGTSSTGNVSSAKERTLDTESTAASIERPTRRRAAVRYTVPDDSDEEYGDWADFKVSKKDVPRQIVKARPQVRLAPLKSLESLSDLRIQDDTPEKQRRRLLPQDQTRRLLQKRASPRKKNFRESSPGPGVEKLPVVSTAGGQAPEQDKEIDEELNFEESIWCGSEAGDSESDKELPSPSSFFPVRRKVADEAPSSLDRQLKAVSIFDDEKTDAPPSKTRQPDENQLQRPGSSSDKENHDAVVRFSPPRIKKPFDNGTNDRTSTPPPASPTKSKLQSPSKRPPRVPTPPMRSSLDAFWTAEAVNEWNDTYSPQKVLRSPAKKLFQTISAATFDDTPIISPAKLQSPFKRTKAEVQARKDWEARKITLAGSFLSELDEKITAGKIAELSASTGGVEIVWSKTLNSTAGRANWRRETTKSHSRSDPSQTTVTHKHFASIELASKVLTYNPAEPAEAETKLLNVLAHEFCHLANFMISNVKTNPHGASFKAWGEKCTKTFRNRGVEVTTKHNYEIEYKYIWQCEDVEKCGMEFKRHSKSIDVQRHRCGGCKAPLVQVKPVPRGAAAASSSGRGTPVEGVSGRKKKPATGYAAFVKGHFADLKKGMVGASHKEVMEALGRKYRAEKETKRTSAAAAAAEEEDINAMARKLDQVKLEVNEIIDLTD